MSTPQNLEVIATPTGLQWREVAAAEPKPVEPSYAPSPSALSDGDMERMAMAAIKGLKVVIKPIAKKSVPVTHEPEPAADKPLSTIDQLIVTIATAEGMDPALIHAVISVESAYKTDAVSSADAHGLMQLIPATAERFGVKDSYDPEDNIRGGTRYLKWLLAHFDGDLDLALAGYNAGENAVKKYGNTIPPYKETQNYVRKVRAALERS